MATELPNSGNMLDVVLEPEVEEEPISAGQSTPGFNILSFEDAIVKPSYVSDFPGLAKVSTPLSEKIIVWDTETTGTNPWDSRLLVLSFWDLSRPVAEMVTFADFDEEKLTRDVAEYLNSEQPTAMICYNNGFDQRFLLSRLMLYQVAVPGWNQIKQYDVMDILKKGTTQSIASSQPTGTEEAWFKYMFNEDKPYTVEECFEGVRDGDLSRFIIRNRTCTASEGYLYLLFRSVTDTDELPAAELKPTAVNITEAKEAGICLVDCPACSARNQVPCNSKDNTCWRCLGRIPDPTSLNVVKEVLREYDFSTVGLKANK